MGLAQPRFKPVGGLNLATLLFIHNKKNSQKVLSPNRIKLLISFVLPFYVLIHYEKVIEAQNSW